MEWTDPEPVDVPPGLYEAVGGPAFIADALVRCGLRTPAQVRAFLDPAAYVPGSPTELPGLAVAAARVREALQVGEPIVVWGDFDADGQTATALLLQTLRAAGGRVTAHIPSRSEGHGVHASTLDRLAASGARLLITCDTGTTAHSALERASAVGLEVIVTDHHLPGPSLPRALAVVNPHHLPSSHPMASLSGVGVAYQLARQVAPTLADLGLDLVALGSVADVSTLLGDTRYLVQLGIQALRNTARLGLLAIYEAAEVRQGGLTEDHIGYLLAPRLNALGRLAHASRGVDLLTTEDWSHARILATEVEGLNAQRQWLTRQVTDAALAQIEREPSLLSDYRVLLLGHPTWPPGIIGVVAGRLAELVGKPAALVSSPPGELARGSARSVPGVDVTAALAQCSDLLDRYGGHAGAAGFSLHAGQIPHLRLALSRAIEAQQPVPLVRRLAIDATLRLPDLSFDLVTSIGRLAPFGPGNPLLVLAIRDLRIVRNTALGRHAEHRRLVVQDADGTAHTVFWWHGAGHPVPSGRFDLACTVRASDYRGAAEVQVDWIDARSLSPEAVQVAPTPPIQVADLRQVQDREARLRELAAAGDLQIWSEGVLPLGLETKRRHELRPCPNLAIYTLPPGPRELQAALEKAQPRQVFFFAVDPSPSGAAAFLRLLTGMVKFALQAKEGRLDLGEVAAATAQRTGTVQAGLEWLVAHRQVEVDSHSGDVWNLRRGGGSGSPTPDAGVEEHGRVEYLLAETRAYRAYLVRAPADGLIEALSTG